MQGYLADKKQPPPLGPPWGPRHRPTAGSGGGALSQERGAPVRCRVLWLGLGVETLAPPAYVLPKLLNQLQTNSQLGAVLEDAARMVMINLGGVGGQLGGGASERVAHVLHENVLLTYSGVLCTTLKVVSEVCDDPLPSNKRNNSQGVLPESQVQKLELTVVWAIFSRQRGGGW